MEEESKLKPTQSVASDEKKHQPLEAGSLIKLVRHVPDIRKPVSDLVLTGVGSIALALAASLLDRPYFALSSPFGRVRNVDSDDATRSTAY
jgi:hypothetical protein